MCSDPQKPEPRGPERSAERERRISFGRPLTSARSSPASLFKEGMSGRDASQRLRTPTRVYGDEEEPAAPAKKKAKARVSVACA